jgi:hypothetical protein
VSHLEPLQRGRRRRVEHVARRGGGVEIAPESEAGPQGSDLRPARARAQSDGGRQRGHFGLGGGEGGVVTEGRTQGRVLRMKGANVVEHRLRTALRRLKEDGQGVERARAQPPEDADRTRIELPIREIGGIPGQGGGEPDLGGDPVGRAGQARGIVAAWVEPFVRRTPGGRPPAVGLPV